MKKHQPPDVDEWNKLITLFVDFGLDNDDDLFLWIKYHLLVDVDSPWWKRSKQLDSPCLSVPINMPSSSVPPGMCETIRGIVKDEIVHHMKETSK